MVLSPLRSACAPALRRRWSVGALALWPFPPGARTRDWPLRRRLAALKAGRVFCSPVRCREAVRRRPDAFQLVIVKKLALNACVQVLV